MMRINVQTFLAILCLSCICSVTEGQEWTRFRGPNGQGISHAENIPIMWKEKDYGWKVELAGKGHSSPVIWGEKVFVTSGDQRRKKGYLQAFRASDGKLLWTREYSIPSYRVSGLNSYATGTPSVDRNRIYALWPAEIETNLVATDHDGNQLWTAPFAGAHSVHGSGISTIVVGDLVFFAHEQPDTNTTTKSAWVAVDAKSGETRWTLDRQNHEFFSYSTPCLFPLNVEPGRMTARIVFMSCAHGMTGVQPFTGDIAWEMNSVFPNRVVSSPVIADDNIIGTCGTKAAGVHLIAIDPGTEEDDSQPELSYKIEGTAAPFVPTPLAKDGLLFTFHDKGDVTCLRASTGEQLWSRRPDGKFYGSPIWVGGNLYCMTRKGRVVVLKADEEYDLLAVNDLGEMSYATPAVSGGRMFLRTYSHLVCIGGDRE